LKHRCDVIVYLLAKSSNLPAHGIHQQLQQQQQEQQQQHETQHDDDDDGGRWAWPGDVTQRQ